MTEAHLLESVEGLIYSLVKPFAKGIPGQEMDDLLQEGRLAALKAIRAHDPARGALSTLVTAAVKNRLKDLHASATSENHLALNSAVEMDEVLLESLGCGLPDPDEAMLSELTLQELHGALEAACRDDLDRSIVDSLLYDVTVGDLASLHDVKPSLVYARKASLLKRTRGMLEV